MDLFELFKLDWANLGAIEIINVINILVTSLLGILLAYKTIYVVIGFLPQKHYKKSEIKTAKYAFLIAARNEELVIGKLLDSINKQDYPRENITIFVVADNCTDKTAEIARLHGAVVYERHDLNKARKGYALDFLTRHIDQDYGLKNFDYYIVFDADNLLNGDYVSRINDVFMAGHKIVTSYRNVKNFDNNIVSASYGFHQYRTLRTNNNPRTLLGLGCVVTGTGFAFANEVLGDGYWRWTLLNEDLEFTVDTALKGYRTVYCADAIFYDEQPTTIKMMLRQRTRWAKGFLQVLVAKHNQMLRGIFTKKYRRYEDKQNKLQYHFMQYDLYFHVFPYGLVTFFWKILVYLALLIATLFTQGTALQLLRNIGVDLLISLIVFWIIGIAQILPVLIIEWKKIYARKISKVLYMFTFPLFDIISIPLSLAALFVKPEWKKIVHDDERNIDVVNDFFTSEEKRREERRKKREDRRLRKETPNG